MPQQRDPLKIRELPVLLRDARTTQHEIDSAPTEHKQRELRHARDSAINELIKIGQTGMHRGEKLGALDRCRIRNFCKDLGTRNRKTRMRGLPKRNGGRPKERPARLRLAVAIWEAIETNRKRPKHEREKASSMLNKVARRLHKKLSYVTEGYYDREWRRAVEAELFFNKENVEIEKSRAEIKQRRDETEIARLATLLPSEYAQLRETASKALGMRPAALDITVKRAQKRKV